MGGSPSKQARPSYEDGKVRDPDLAMLIKEKAPPKQDARETVSTLIKRAARKEPPDYPPLH